MFGSLEHCLLLIYFIQMVRDRFRTAVESAPVGAYKKPQFAMANCGKYLMLFSN